MGKRKDIAASEEVNSRILLLILDELRAIRKRVDTALGPDNGQLAPPQPPAQRPPTPPPVEEDAREAEIIEAEIVDAQELEPAAAPEPEVTEQSEPEQPQNNAAAPEQPRNIDPFNLPAPASPDDEDKLFGEQKQRIENMMSVAQFARAEKLAQALLAAIPDSNEAEALLDTVRRESFAFRTEQQSRLFAEFQRWTESRQWIKAQTVGEQLIEKYPAGKEGQKVAASMSTVRQNAHFEEARTLRDRIRDLIKRKRYSDAVEVAEDLIHRFPNTQVAKQLRSLLPDLKRRSAHFR